MSIRHIANGVTIILTLLCILLAILIFKQWVRYSHEGPIIEDSLEQPARAKQVTPNLFLGNRGKTIQITQFSEILARPLFTEGRHPEEQPEPENELTQQVGLPQLRLEGVVISPDSRVAVVRDQTNNTLLRLSEGMILSGWRVTSVNTVEAVLERDGDTHKLPLELVKNPAQKSSTSRFRLPPSKAPAKPRPAVKSP